MESQPIAWLPAANPERADEALCNLIQGYGYDAGSDVKPLTRGVVTGPDFAVNALIKIAAKLAGTALAISSPKTSSRAATFSGPEDSSLSLE